ncbi:hypothetical protein ACFE04_004711 [Oxalis oulophora]
MDSNMGKHKLARRFAKVMHIRALTGISPLDEFQKPKSREKTKLDQKRKPTKTLSQAFVSTILDEKLENRKALEAIVAKLFSSISTIKSEYAQIQYAQSPYNAQEIQAADKLVVSEFKSLSEWKQCFLKKQFDFSPEKIMVSAEIQESRSLLKTYETMGKKLEHQLNLKKSEVGFLKETLHESYKQNKSIEKRLDESGELKLNVLENVHLSGLNPTHFTIIIRHTVKSIRIFVRQLIDEMKSSCWDIDAAASIINPDVVYSRPNDKCFAFESFVCREMFDSFHHWNYDSLPKKSQQRQLFWERFTELKSVTAKKYVALNPDSTFAKFCKTKYLQLIHPKMESSFFGDLTERDLVSSGKFPLSPFFVGFAEMARWVWLLHCLAFSFEHEVSIFRVQKGYRFSNVYMENLAEEAFCFSEKTERLVALTVFPGFRIGKTVLQCQVYLNRF